MVENLGDNINTIGDELFYLLTKDERSAFYTKNKEGSYYIFEIKPL